MARWAAGEKTVQFLVDRNRLESFEVKDLVALTGALVGRAVLRVETTAAAALAGGDVDGAFVAAYDGYRMAAEALLARQAFRATGGDGSHMAVEDAVSAQFGAQYRHSRSRRLSGSGEPVIRRSTSILPRRRSPHRMRSGQSERRQRSCQESRLCWQIRRRSGSASCLVRPA